MPPTMARKARSKPHQRSARAPSNSYWDASRQPLQILAFLLPLILLYEIALPWLIASRGRDVKAHKAILQFFEAVGMTHGALYLGGLLIIVVLLAWHLMEHRPWSIDLGTSGLMAIESLLLIIPLLVLARIIGEAEFAGMLPMAAPSAGGAPDYAQWSLLEQITLSIGAGLYEELLFRMLLIAVLHTLLVDVGKATNTVGSAIAVVVSAAAFTWYHPLAGANGNMALDKTAFYFLGGLYFGGIYAARGFGIVVGVHALYDVVTLVWEGG